MNIYKKTKLFLNVAYHTKVLERRLKYEIKHDKLIELTLNDTKQGVLNENYCDHEIVVSLTTFGKRLYDVALTIESIMQGSMKPNRIVLWLGYELKGVPLPLAIQRQQKRGLEVAFCKDVRSYTKLVPALCKYPNAAIITIDDDVIYEYDLVEKLVNTHIANPQNIISNRIHRVLIGNDNRPLGYMQWKWCDTPKDASHLNFLTGVGGVLYPPNSLHPEVLNEKVFLEICSHADDIWFNAMALMAGTKVMKCYTHSEMGEDYIINESVQDIGLCNYNTSVKNADICANDIQLKAVFDKYNLWDKLLE